MLLPWFAVHTLPLPSTAMLKGSLMPPPVKLSATVRSKGCAPRAGANGGVPVDSAYKFATFVPGLCAMSIAAVAVSVGVVLPFIALDISVPHAVESEPDELMHAARMFGPACLSRFAAPYRCPPASSPALRRSTASPGLLRWQNAFAIPVLASGVPEPRYVGLATVANPANAYAAAMVDTSFATM